VIFWFVVDTWSSAVTEARGVDHDIFNNTKNSTQSTFTIQTVQMCALHATTLGMIHYICSPVNVFYSLPITETNSELYICGKEGV